MKDSILLFFLFIIFTFVNAQEIDQKVNSNEFSPLFDGETSLDLTLNYSKKELLKFTNDSTYIKSNISYSENKGGYNNMEVKLRARGNYRRKNCYYLPLWLKINKAESKGTIFEGEKKIKIVLPCLKSKRSNDNIVKEYLAYKIFECLSPYYFKTKLIPIHLEEQIGGKKIDHALTAILIQDDKKLAATYNGNIIKKNTHAYNQDPVSSVRNALFQFMIGNTDFSVTYRHNEKLFFIDKKIVPVPFDFDMSGLVNPSYAIVSVVNEIELPITSVTQRMYRGFERDEKVVQQVRQEFLDRQTEIFNIIDQHQIYFINTKEFVKAREFISDFYKIIGDDQKFDKIILKRSRNDLKD